MHGAEREPEERGLYVRRPERAGEPAPALQIVDFVLDPAPEPREKRRVLRLHWRTVASKRPAILLARLARVALVEALHVRHGDGGEVERVLRPPPARRFVRRRGIVRPVQREAQERPEREVDRKSVV